MSNLFKRGAGQCVRECVYVREREGEMGGERAREMQFFVNERGGA